MVLNQLEELASKASEDLGKINDSKDLEAWRVRFLGRKSSLTQILRLLASLPLEERRAVGARANEIKLTLETRLEEKKRELEVGSVVSVGLKSLDVTLPGKPLNIGRMHLTTQILEEICDILGGMGFQVAEGPDVEWDYYNFEALNMPTDHPARDMFATLWIDYEKEGDIRPMLLRTHTSPVQIRVMEKSKPPIRIIAPGRVYRYEATDATHEWMFHQVEGLAVDKNITMADLKGTLFEFARCLFGKDRKCRFRCDYFPFVEPGVEVAIDCFECGGTGCRLCGNSGWIEILGAGMVHPEVLRRVNIDPDVYSGFAFGIGVERIPLLRYGIDDIRLFYANDLRFLSQF
ncbi:MAG: phenylalanine--tRNA ligase subunit alpha [Chloroflexi bacterium]|nr:phenylalanine--tRNA ligase subunit alpha [Chloroflexota bacterium]MBM3173907.1 phenylalanine--tRNA ligase subunit alpha [Chloroflexota bacterium]MBM3174632.1 phenylalanine--tRNA ligase subunit alpha [Chloroflexota bacterium]MBM4449386.1 phenylalanine--tRNA ligase subunit alpha [Chloroflexota bacterium]